MLERLKLLIADPALRQKMGTAAVTHARAFDWTRVCGTLGRSRGTSSRAGLTGLAKFQAGRRYYRTYNR